MQTIPMNLLGRKSCSAEASTIFVFHLHCTTIESNKKECASAHSRAERGRLRHSSSSCECASPARSAFYFIGNSFGISYETKKNYPHHVKDNSFLFYIMLLTSILLSVSSWSSGLRLRILLHRQRRLPTYWPCRGLPG